MEFVLYLLLGACAGVLAGLFGVGGGHVHSTIAHGKVLMRSRQLLTLDEEAITARSRQVAQATWERYWAMF